MCALQVAKAVIPSTVVMAMTAISTVPSVDAHTHFTRPLHTHAHISLNPFVIFMHTHFNPPNHQRTHHPIHFPATSASMSHRFQETLIRAALALSSTAALLAALPPQWAPHSYRLLLGSLHPTHHLLLYLLEPHLADQLVDHAHSPDTILFIPPQMVGKLMMLPLLEDCAQASFLPPTSLTGDMTTG